MCPFIELFILLVFNFFMEASGKIYAFFIVVLGEATLRHLKKF
jgi:hypothetical protein